MHVAVISSSMQSHLISDVILSITKSRIRVKARDDTWTVPLIHTVPLAWQPSLRWKLKPSNKKKQGKLDHFISLACEAQKAFKPEAVLYLDDDPVCITAARAQGIVGLQVRLDEDGDGGGGVLGDIKAIFIEGGELPEIVETKSGACILS